MEFGREAHTEAPMWVPQQLEGGVPPYLALLKALEDDVKRGGLPPGTRLAPHRILAARLGISISTVGKAYREAAARGLISGRTGQGTFVHASGPRQSTARTENGVVNLGFNLAPKGSQREAIRGVLADLVRSPDLDTLFNYGPHQGFEQHRDVLARWLAVPSLAPTPAQVVLTNGAQHGLDIAVQILCRPGEAVLVEDLTYIGFKALASSRQFPLVPVAMDEEGLLPEALEAAIERSGARVLYATPTLHSPTARTMSARRRAAVAAVLARKEIHLIEDDVYAFLIPDRPAPIASLVPERTIHLTSFSKVLDLGFRLGAMVVPPALVERANLAMRATAWITAPIIVEVVTRLIEAGTLDALIEEIRQESAARYALFCATFAAALPPDQARRPSGYHTWLPLPAGTNLQDLFYAARNRGILLTPPGSAAVEPALEQGVRLCLGASDSRAELQHVLTELRQLIERPSLPLFSMT